MTKQYLELLFNDGEWAGFGAFPHTTRAYDVLKPPPTAEFVTLNPLIPQSDRRDSNVSRFSNFLVEMDAGSLTEQKGYVSSMEMPFSCATYSGGKSIHFVICLEENLTEQEWRGYARAILDVMKRADQTTKNPSRYTRLGGATRKDKNTYQEVLILKERINKAQLDEWLQEHGMSPRPKLSFTTEEKRVTIKYINRYTRDFLLNGAEEGNRNNAAFQASVNLLEVGYTPEQVLSRLKRWVGKGYREDEINKIVKSAIQRVESTRR